MSKIDEILNFLINDLNIKISNKKRDLINNKFYPDIKDKIYWSVHIKERRKTFFYEGIITKDEYDLIKTLPSDTNITFNSDYKDDDDDEGDISEIIFIDDVNKVKKIYDKRFEENASYCDLMFYLYENEILKK
jgi:hypothetical protein